MEKPNKPELPIKKLTKSNDLCLIIVGMAGSGKTTFTANFKNYLMEKTEIEVFASNLDPVVLETPYSCEYDIRKDFEHAEIMKKYKLGPNGAIMTCLNLFCAQIDKFVEKIQKVRGEGENLENVKINNEIQVDSKDEGNNNLDNKNNLKKEDAQNLENSKLKSEAVKKLFLVDTPGQIEAFMWSASGEIITKTLAATMPTAMCFILDR